MKIFFIISCIAFCPDVWYTFFMKRNLRITLYSILFILLLVVAPALLFTFVPLPLWAGIALLSCGLVYALVCMSVNLIKQKRYEKNLFNTQMSDLQTQFEKRREEIQSGIRASAEKLSRLLKAIIAYNISLVFAFWCISSGLIALMRATIPLSEDFKIQEFCLVAVIVCTYLFVFYMPVATTLFRSSAKTDAPFWQKPLSEQDYPLLYAVAQKSAQAIGFQGRYRLLPGGDSGISVSEEGGTVYLSLPPALLPLLTQDELYSIFIHEFAHAMHDDTKLSEKYNKLNYRYGERKGFEKIATAFFSYAGSLIDRETDLLLQYSSIVREKSADEEVIKHADAQTFMNATAKSYLFDEVFREPIALFTYDFYASEKPPENYYRLKTAYFEEHAREFYPHALEILMRRLPARNDTHPTFKMRAETFGISVFDPFLVPDGEYREETFRLSDACGKELYRSLLQDWDYLHEENYESVKETVERYESTENASEALKLLAMNAYRNINYDNALALAEKLLKEDENCNSARYIKGFILCVRDDEAGLPLLLEAIRDDFNLADAFELYGDVILRTGKQELLDELREMQAPFGQEILEKMKQRMKEGGVKPARLVPCEKDGRYEIIVASVRDVAQDELKDVYLCEDARKNNGRRIYVVLPYPASEKARTCAGNLQSYFSMLWRKNEEYYTCFCKPTDKLYRHAKAHGEKIV